ncbi:hypothetical protein K491DRAFT_761424 [Lophiostoma macrostomum CBS 122681]|uniref:Rubredoxin-like domain-containing protein n=1 Tax=Lophiostoma macrostomum CBS 122681 TaxID=1314788 RepID=A0A6A6SWT8_9PLEO|nr:hypothetical protein K491DRAFT_761424 [Lophiostoma macrostomum CBS 122681]
MPEWDTPTDEQMAEARSAWDNRSTKEPSGEASGDPTGERESSEEKQSSSDPSVQSDSREKSDERSSSSADEGERGGPVDSKAKVYYQCEKCHYTDYEVQQDSPPSVCPIEECGGPLKGWEMRSNGSYERIPESVETG